MEEGRKSIEPYEVRDRRDSSIKDINRSSKGGPLSPMQTGKEMRFDTGYDDPDRVEDEFNRLMNARSRKQQYESTDHIHKGYFFSLLLTILIGSFQFGYLIGGWNGLFKPWLIYMDKTQENCGGVYLKYPGCAHSNYDEKHNDYSPNDNKQYWSQTIQGITMTGAMLGAFISGPLASIGRWKVLIICNILILISQIAASVPYCIGNIYIYISTKFIFGIACGGFSFICPKFVNETSPKEYVGGAGAMFQVVVCFGITIGNIIPVFFPSNGGLLDGDAAKFILMFSAVLSIFLSLLQLMLLICVFRFDTPKFMKEQGHDSKLREVLCKLYEPHVV